MQRSLSTRKRSQAFKRTKLAIQQLEERTTPVVGAWDIPAEINPGAGYDGIARINNGTGTLLNSARHMLTAAHVASGTVRFDMPWGVAAVGAKDWTVSPNFNGSEFGYGDWSNTDMAVLELAELGPLTATRYGIYTGSDEVGKTVKFYGYGKTGTGSSGHASQVGVTNPNVGNTEIARLTISGNPTGGGYQLNMVGIGAVNLDWNATAFEIESKLELLDKLNDVWVTKLTGLNPYAGSFEIHFRDVDGGNNINNLQVSSFITGGTATVKTLINGDEPRGKRMGQNVVSGTQFDGIRLTADFDDGSELTDRWEDGGPLSFGRESSPSHGDSGGPMFIGNKIAGINTKLDAGVRDSDPDNADFGHYFGWERVSVAKDFINEELDKPFDLVLNMNNQAPGNDGGLADKITFQQVGSKLQILFGNSVVYTESMDKILSIRFIGSDDAETVIFKNINKVIPLKVDSGGGDDDIRVEKNILGQVEIFAGEGKDEITLGHADGFGLVSNIVQAYGESGNDDIRVINNRIDMMQALGGIGDDYIQFSYVGSGNTGIAAGEAGYDEVHVGVGNLRSQILGTLIASPGGQDFDEIHVNDQFNTDLADYILTKDSVDKSASFFGNIELTNATRLWLNANGKGTDIHVQSTNPNSQTTINAKNGDDTIILGGAALQTVEGYVAVNGGAGKDTFDVRSVPADTHLQLNGGTNNDTLLVGRGNIGQWVNGFVKFNGENGYDHVEIDDQLDEGEDAYTMGATGMLKDGLAHTLMYDTVESVTLRANDDSNAIALEGAKPGMSVKIFGNGGDDDVTLGLDKLKEAFTGTKVNVHGGFGLDTLIINDSNNSADTVNTLFENSFQQVGLDLGLTFDWMNTVNLKNGIGDDLVGVVDSEDGMNLLLQTSSGEDKVFVQKSGVDSRVDIETGGDDDQVYLAPFGQDLDVIGGPVLVNGGTGADKVYVNDQKDTENDFYRLDPTKVEKKNALGFNNGGGAGGGGNGWRTILEYSDLSYLEVNTNKGSNEVEILGTADGTNTKVNGGLGNEKFIVQQPPALDLTLVGGSGTDTSFIKGTDANDVVQVQGTTFDFEAQGRVINQTVENFNYDGKDGLDIVNYAGTQGKVDAVKLNASTTAGTGVLDVPGIIKVNFKNSEMFEIIGNSGENDSFVMNGTAENDSFDISLHSSGTPGDRVAELFAPDATRLLALIDAKNVGTARFNGLAGNDRFELLAGPFGSTDERKIMVDGGDQLDVRGDSIGFRAAGSETPTVSEQAKQGDADAGSISIDFLSHQFEVDFDGIETKEL